MVLYFLMAEQVLKAYWESALPACFVEAGFDLDFYFSSADEKK